MAFFNRASAILPANYPFGQVKVLASGCFSTLCVLALILTSLPASAAQYLQCVPFAREMSGVQIYGDAHTWWRQASGKYDRGQKPKIGSVMSFKSSPAMPLGHIAVVAKIKNSRELLVSHANWSPINGRRGQIERNVLVRDVSDRNDWSSVRVWYAPTQELGVRNNPLNGFIYPVKPGQKFGDDAIAKPKNDDVAVAKLDKKALKKAAKDKKAADKAARKAAKNMAETLRDNAKSAKRGGSDKSAKPVTSIKQTPPAHRSVNDWDRSASPQKPVAKSNVKPGTNPAKKLAKNATPALDAVMARLDK